MHNTANERERELVKREGDKKESEEEQERNSEEWEIDAEK